MALEVEEESVKYLLVDKTKRRGPTKRPSTGAGGHQDARQSVSPNILRWQFCSGVTPLDLKGPNLVCGHPKAWVKSLDEWGWRWISRPF